jgi:hypothetical protein
VNQTFKITAKSPLLRPGLEISVEVSGKYLSKACEDLLSKVREINAAKMEAP